MRISFEAGDLSSNPIAVQVTGLGKSYVLGETHEGSLSGHLGRGLRRMLRQEVSSLSTGEIFWALRDVGFALAQGEALGIVGSNGAGKSTLLKILSRITPPTTGKAIVRGRLASLLEVGTGFHPELTGRENVFLNGTILGMRHAEVARKFDEIVAFSGVEKFIDTPVKRYSSGMHVRLAFAVAAHLEPDVLIVDEVLAVGDAEFQKRCLGKMSEVAGQGRTVLFVSHNMAAVQKLCSRAIWLRGGSIAATGEPDVVIAAYLEDSATTSSDGQAQVPGYLFKRADSENSSGDATVTALQVLDHKGRPLTNIQTWDRVVFIIEFYCAKAYRSFSAVIQVFTPDGVSLLLTSTAPDHGVTFSVDRGAYRVECVFDRWPLSAGEYVLGLGLAIPGVEYVFRDDNVCRLHVAPRDIFESGLPPSSNRYLIASPHRWSAPHAIDSETISSHG